MKVRVRIVPSFDELFASGSRVAWYMSSSSKEVGAVAIVPVAICLWMDFLIPSAFFGISMAFSASSNTDAALIFCSAEEEEEEEEVRRRFERRKRDERKGGGQFCVCVFENFLLRFSPRSSIGLFPFPITIYNGRKGFRSIDRSDV